MEGGVAPFSSSMAPSGSYILIVVSQPVEEEHKKLILERLNKGLLSWDVESTGCDLSGLETVCSSISAKHLDDTDVLIQHSTESLGVEVLVSPTVSTLKQCVKNLFSTSTGHKHLIHAGYTFAGTGSWILQNGTFSFDEFLEIFQQADVQSQKRCNIQVHCAELGSWNAKSFEKDIFAKVANVSLNPQEKVSHVPGSEHLIACLEKVLSSQALEDIMEASTLVGNIRFNRPTLYLFPAGQGDCALFGINGFNMLIDGGFNRKPCSWEFIRHLDRLDAVIVTRLCENNVCGMSTLMKRKSMNNTYPQIGYVFCNLGDTNLPSPKDEIIKNKDELVVSVVGEGHTFTQTLNELKLKPHQCWRDSSVEPFVLYHKVGHGTLEMHVLSPPKDSKEMKDFLTEWSSYKETFSCIKSGLKSKSLENAIPLSHATSICAVLIWRPADPKDTITRILFPGSAPQSKIFESLDRLKNLDVLKQPVVTKASLSVAVTKSANNKVTKSVSRTSVPNRKNTASPAPSVSSVASRNGDVNGVKKEVKKVVKEVKKDNKEIIKKEVKKEIKKDVKEVKKDAPAPKREASVKKEIVPKRDNKDVKQVVKKDTKEIKAATDKKQEIKSTIKKTESASLVGKATEVKKTATTTVKKSAPAIKKDTTKTTTVTKSSEIKKTASSKVSELKAVKDVSNKKAAETKTAAKPKAKSATTVSKSPPKASPKTPSAVSKPGNKVTKAVAASSIVASVVAVTAAAFELNEKKEEIVDVEQEVSEKDVEQGEELKELGVVEKSEEMNVSPLPPEALSPEPSESISLSPSDTLSSAPLETVSPTPPLANEPMSVEEKEVNEIKDIEQDPIPYEVETAQDVADEMVEEQDEIEKIIAQHQENADVMSSSFMGSRDVDEQEIEEVIVKTESSNVFASRDIPSADTKMINEAEIVDEDKVVDEENDMGYNGISKPEETIDDQLAQLSMEGSFCAGRNNFEVEKDIVEDIEEQNKVSEVNQLMSENHFEQEEEKQQQIDMNSSLSENRFEQEDEQQMDMSRSFIEIHDEEEDAQENAENVSEDACEKENKNLHSTSDNVDDSNYQNNQFASEDLDRECVADMQEKEVADEKDHDENPCSPEPLEEQHIGYNNYAENQTVESIEQSFASRRVVDDYDTTRNIIEDADMQESSVDEPEEILRKESVVSITLNDDSAGVNYDDEARRKSYAESEDDVDIQNYMKSDRKDSFDHDKLNAREDVDSDNEDVVKSPTPHAVVDFEDDVEEAKISEVTNQDNIDMIQNAAYLTEKQDLEEKDHDSAENEDSDDGEMIRHPTPELKYSEDEMRDPIGQHYITAPGLKSQVGLSEEPLYEEPEDAASDRSESPVVEQPVFGSVVEADFPEMVTVSGGTTPSEPHSPKAGFDTKKFISEAAVMDALSEHDVSEGSTHSPLCHDGNSAFELPVAAENLESESSQDFATDQVCGNQDDDETDIHAIKQETEEKAYIQETEEKAYIQETEEKAYIQETEEKAYIQETEEKAYIQETELHSYKQEDSHSHEDESREMRGFEQYTIRTKELAQDNKEIDSDTEEKDVHDFKRENEDFHAYEQESKDTRSYEQNEDMYLQEQNREDLRAYEEETKDVQPLVSQTPDFENESIQKETIVGSQQAFHDDKTDVALDGSYDDPSDDESYSQNEKSETKSEKSDNEDEKSDIHQDDRSDHQHDSKSDMMDDDQISRKSDMHEEDDRSDSHYDDKQDSYGGNNYEVPEDTRSHHYGGETLVMEENGQYGMNSESFKMENKHNFELGEKDVPAGFVHEIEDQKLSAPQDFGRSEETNDYMQKEFESNISRLAEDSTINMESVSKAKEEITDNFNIPSGFEDSGNISQGFSSNITPANDFNEFNLSNQEHVDINTMNFEPPQYQDNFESSYGQYETIHAKENNSEFSKDSFGFQAPDNSSFGKEETSNFQTELVNVSGGLPSDANKLQELEKHDIKAQSTDDDIISPQHSESLSSIENKVLTEMTEAHQYETLSKFEENVHTSNISYSESSSSKYDHHDGYSEMIDTEGKNYNFVSEEFQHVSAENNFRTTEAEDVHQEISAESYSQMTSSMHAGISEKDDEDIPYEYGSNTNYDNKGFVESLRSTTTDGEILQTRAEVHESAYGYSQETESKHIVEDDTENELVSQLAGNGKDQPEWRHSEFSSQETTELGSSVVQEHVTYSTHSEQETSYIINSRFHSDSPEDNIMRSDSSPDVPPYPLDTSGQLADLTIAKGDYTDNMNLPKGPKSPSKLARNANHDSPYGESSEEDEEDSSSFVPGNVSPYAYTNKAYTKEEEDVDGNHIYKETIENTTAETINDFDGNNSNTLVGYEYQETTTTSGINPQTTTTQQVTYQQGYQEQGHMGETNYDFRLEEWGKPMGLPTPPDSTQKTVAPKKPEKKSLGKPDTNGKTHSPSVSKMSSPMKKPKATKEPSCSPVYVDLAYVPHHGDPQYCDIEFFKKVRARYYVFSGINPSKEVLNALLEAKKGWKEDLEVTIIPTYETDTLGYWMAQNQEALAEYSIEVAPSASRCTVNLQDHETSCAAYRLEF